MIILEKLRTTAMFPHHRRCLHYDFCDYDNKKTIGIRGANSG
jgi:hypothetical protein